MQRVLLLLALWLPLVGASPPEAKAALIQPYASAPLCLSHNIRAYHGLWNYTLGCHYDHEHGDSPYAADDVFGSGYYLLAGGAISYPWQTPNENASKHNSYKWFVRKGLDCANNQYITSPGCITDFRAQVHADLFNVVSDYHSMALEMRVCLIADPTNCGIVRLGGWQYSGDFTIDNQIIVDRPDLPYLPSETRQIHAASLGDPRNDSWYLGMANPLSVRVAHRTQDNWGYYPLPFSYPLTATMSISDYHFFCAVDFVTGAAAPNCYTNGSKRMPDVVSFQPGQIRAILDPDGDQVANYQGYTDRYGNIVQGCGAVALDCIPISFEHVPLPLGIWYQWRVPFTDTLQPREYDITFGGMVSGWLEYPN